MGQVIGCIECHLDEIAAGCRVTRVAGVDGLDEGLLEFFVISVLDGFVQRREARRHHRLHEPTLLAVDGGREHREPLHLLHLVSGYRPVAGFAGAVHDVEALGKVRHERGERPVSFQRGDARL